ncbi:nuclear transport factor 2 family protein [Fulvivirgaceae bacterium BMA10]|uniref:Nuclear transport factor 2 family protein n=1 Tax=Splendidivirga corallicola TaxID=3051826 RepID=A0ABT8KXK0_9BACT|nr:nuclear transport factor 2 family protein [Fulvivirgaceae bacterium BMA10]
MKSTQELVNEWFDIWNKGNFQELPLAEDFKHISPYGTIEGKSNYMELIESNRDKFLGNRIEMHDEIYEGNRGCVRYNVSKGDFSMNVSEWLYIENDKIKEISAYYNIKGEISEDRKLSPGSYEDA